MCGQFPFKGKDEKQLYQNILKGKLEFPIYVPFGAKNLIAKLLQ